jgi:hypothetical protein
MRRAKISNEAIRKTLKLSKDQLFRYINAYPEQDKNFHLDKQLIKTEALKEINRNLNPIEFCDAYLPIKLKPMQRLILKAFYNLKLSADDKKRLLKLKNQGKTTWEEGGTYQELVLLIGMKGGKTTLAAVIAQIEEYELYKIGDICGKYGFVPGEEIYIKNVATNEKQAFKTIFAKIKASIERSPYFKARYPKEKENIFHFQDTNVFIESGHSNSSSLVGDNCKLVLLDELDRFRSTNGKYSAEEVYSALDKSTDPFGRDGKKVSISSLVHDKGFMVELYNKCRTIKSMLGFWMPEWEMQPDRYSGKVFLHGNVKIPIEHHDSYRKNPEKFLRDKACMLGYTKGAYYKEPHRVRHCLEQSYNIGMRDPIDQFGRFAENFRGKNFKYFEHHDPSVSHDAYAVCLGHMEKDFVIIDMVHRFLPPAEGGEIDIEKVKEFCDTLHERFPSLELITYDTWAASALMQSFSKKGFKVENLYIKKPQHDLLKEKIYSDKFRCHKHRIFSKELTELELNGDKVDHPQDGSKDTADSVAGVVWNCVKAYGTGVTANIAVKSKEDKEPVRAGFKKLNGRRRKIWESSLVY